jgi:hypothetical protein
MVRAVALVCLGLGIVMLLGYLTYIGKGPLASLEASHLREGKDRLATPDHPEPITQAEFESLPPRLTVAEYSGIERRAVVAEGWVWRMVRSSDGDFHLNLWFWKPVPGIEPPYVTAEITPQWWTGGTGGVDPDRGWSYDHLLRVFHPDYGGVTAWDGGPVKIRLTGWLLYDYESRGHLPFQRSSPRRPIDWEIHPVTRIERWDDARSAWIEVPR